MVPAAPLPPPPGGLEAAAPPELIFPEPLEISVEEAVRDILEGCKRLEGEEAETIGYRHLGGVLQAGPTCGLAALAMVSSLTLRKASMQQLLDDAQALGYSRSGEMFSVDNMSDFAKHVLGDYFTVQLFSGGMSQVKDTVLDDLINAKALYLVPYDADRNHSPACLRGHKAHWAVVCGALYSRGTPYVLARQGKSRHIGIWSFDDLDLSNSNLVEIAPNRLSDPHKYIFHDLRTCMAGKFIKLKERAS